MDFDIVIIGGGPAGTAAGLTALKREGLSVAIIESADYSVPRVGESVSPGIRPMMEYLGVWQSFCEENALQSFGSQAAWGSSNMDTLDFLFTVHGAGWNVNRVAFDQMLARQFEQAGGTLLLKSRFMESTREAGQWQVQIINNKGQHQVLKARFLVDATGRKGLLARQQGVERVLFDRLVGIGMFGTLRDQHDVTQTVAVEACEYGWWYTAPTPDGRLSTILMTDADIASELKAARLEKWQELLAATTHTRKRGHQATFEGRLRSFLAHSSMLEKMGGEGWVAIGDSAVSHDPLSSSGIPHALGGGAYGARVAVNALVSDGSLLEDYQTGTQKQYLQYLNTYHQYYHRESRWASSLFWRRRNDQIRLDAMTVVDQRPEVPAHTPVHMNKSQQQALHALCLPDKKAHEIVSEFRQSYQQVPDQAVILELQSILA